MLGLAGESGEVAGKLAKIIRDADGIVSDDDKVEINKELGDVLWFIARIAEETDSSIEEIASINLEKLLSRVARGKIGEVEIIDRWCQVFYYLNSGYKFSIALTASPAAILF